MSNISLLESSERDMIWLKNNYVSIQEEHENQIIAVKSEKIVAVAKNIIELMKKLKKMKVDQSEVLIEPVSSPKEIIVL